MQYAILTNNYFKFAQIGIIRSNLLLLNAIMLTMPQNVKYCSLEPVFPQDAFMLFLFIIHQENVLGIIPFESIFISSTAASLGVAQTVEQFTKTDYGITIPEECLLIPLHLKSIYSLGISCFLIFVAYAQTVP